MYAGNEVPEPPSCLALRGSHGPHDVRHRLPLGPARHRGIRCACTWLTVYLQWQHIKDVTAAHLADVKAFGDKYADVLIKKSESDNALANAIERIGDRIKP